MNEASIIQYLIDTLKGVESVSADGNTFFFFGSDRKFPFATLVTTDDYDQVSNLSRPGVFRLNIGISRATFLSLFGEKPRPETSTRADTVHDFTALDRIMPHPIYGSMFWVCVLNPGEATFEMAKSLLAEACEKASGRRGQ